MWGNLRYIVVTISFLISLTNIVDADQRQKVIDYHSECLDTHGVEEDVLTSFLDGNMQDKEEFYRHLFCTAKKAHLMTEDGKVTTENFEVDMKDVIDPANMANVAAIIRKCLVQKDSILQTIKEAAECFYKEDHGL